MIADEIESGSAAARRRRPAATATCAMLVRASFQMRAFEERFVHAADPLHGGRRPALLRARRDPRRPRLSAADPVARTTTSPSSASSTRPSAASATPRCRSCCSSPAPTASRATVAARGLIAPTSCRRARAPRWPTSCATSTAGATSCAARRTTPQLLETILEESGYTDMLRADRATSQTRLDNLKELVQSMAAFDTLEAYLEHVVLVMDLDRGGRGRRGADHDPALGQGAGVPAGLPARLGGRRLPQPAQHGREGREGPRGGAPPRLRRHHPRPRAGAHLASPPTARSTAAGPASCPRASSTSCRSPTSRPPARPATTAAAPACRRPGSPLGREPDLRAGGYSSPGWRARRRPLQRRRLTRGRSPRRAAARRPSKAKAAWSPPRPAAAGPAPTSAATASSTRSSAMGTVTAIEGNKLTVAFDKAGEKKVIDSFVERG